MIGELTGRKVLAIALGLFAIVLGLNVTLAVLATRTFSGLVVPNSYVASQVFDARRAAQDALGWQAALSHEDGVLRLAFTDAAGRTVRPDTLALTVGRPTTTRDDRAVALAEAPGGYVGAVDLATGIWRAEIEARNAGGDRFQQVRSLYVGPQG